METINVKNRHRYLVTTALLVVSLALSWFYFGMWFAALSLSALVLVTFIFYIAVRALASHRHIYSALAEIMKVILILFITGLVLFAAIIETLKYLPWE